MKNRNKKKPQPKRKKKIPGPDYRKMVIGEETWYYVIGQSRTTIRHPSGKKRMTISNVSLIRRTWQDLERHDKKGMVDGVVTSKDIRAYILGEKRKKNVYDDK